MMRFVYTLFITGILISCAQQQPKNLISRDKMEVLLWQYIRNDVYTSDHLRDSLNRDTVLNKNLQNELFSRFKVSEKDFNDSYNYYSSNPKLLKDILDSISVKERRKDELLTKLKVLPAVDP